MGFLRVIFFSPCFVVVVVVIAVMLSMVTTMTSASLVVGNTTIEFVSHYLRLPSSKVFRLKVDEGLAFLSEESILEEMLTFDNSDIRVCGYDIIDEDEQKELLARERLQVVYKRGLEQPEASLQQQQVNPQEQEQVSRRQQESIVLRSPVFWIEDKTYHINNDLLKYVECNMVSERFLPKYGNIEYLLECVNRNASSDLSLLMSTLVGDVEVDWNHIRRYVITLLLARNFRGKGVSPTVFTITSDKPLQTVKELTAMLLSNDKLKNLVTIKENTTVPEQQSSVTPDRIVKTTKLATPDPKVPPVKSVTPDPNVATEVRNEAAGRTAVEQAANVPTKCLTAAAEDNAVEKAAKVPTEGPGPTEAAENTAVAKSANVAAEGPGPRAAAEHTAVEEAAKAPNVEQADPKQLQQVRSKTKMHASTPNLMTVGRTKENTSTACQSLSPHQRGALKTIQLDSDGAHGSEEENNSASTDTSSFGTADLKNTPKTSNSPRRKEVKKIRHKNKGGRSKKF
eukprot:GHVS01080621.1.p1 GENE.GHVS01080621.1~~GHVS01080621.1.p1  ORF type:complete len:511 (+),score=43.08 GHVS01080621.1:33-1565(+)